MLPAVALALLLAACSGGADGPVQGYVEGTYVYISADDAGRIVARPASAGATVAAGDILVRLDESDEVEAVAGAEARLAKAEAELANLRSGKRPVEISVIEAQLSEAQANYGLAEEEYQRQLLLREKGVVAQAAVDNARARRDAAKASVDAIAHQLEVAQLPARPEEIEAAERNVAAEQAAVAQARIALERRTLKAPDAALVEDTFFEPGEYAAAGAAIVSLLPDANRKLRFFVPEPRLATVTIGSRVGVACDGCPGGLEGEVTFVSSAAEFTPPVIYSKDVRDKLVFRVEAKPLGAAATLKVGQPIDVTLPEAEIVSGAPVIDVKGLTKSFNGKVVVDHVDLSVKRGEIVGFLGPNGSGKTTTIRMICGLLKPDSGSGEVLGYDILTQSDLIKLEVGYMTQRFSFYEDLTIRENLDFVARLYDLEPRRDHVDATLARLGLVNRQNQLAGSLSGGWKQRLALAACVMHQPQLLLLDEPTAGVDPKARREFWDEIHELAAGGLTVLVSTHYMDEAERCHRIVYIAYGKVIARGTVEEVIAGSGLHTIVVRGGDAATLARRLKDMDGVDQVAPFGNDLHVVGLDPIRLDRSVSQAIAGTGATAAPDATSLEDVFIRLMSQSADNFGNGAGVAA